MFLLACVCLLGPSSAAGQWLEETIYLPDSLSGVVFPSVITCSPVSNKVYVSGMHMDGYRRFGADCWVVVLDGTSDRIIGRIPVPTEVTAICYNATDNKVYVNGHDEDSTLTVIDAETDSVIATLALGALPYYTSGLCWNRVLNKVYAQVGRYSAVCSTVAVVDGAADTVIKTVETVRSPSIMVCAPEYDRVYCGSDRTPELAAIDCTADTVCARITLSGFATAACYDSAGGRVFVADLRGDVVVVDAACDSVVASAHVAAGRITSLCYNPLRNRLYCTSLDDELVVLDATSLAVVARVRLVGNWAGTACYDSRTDRVYCAGKDLGFVHILDCATDSVVAVLYAGESPVALCPSPQEVKVYCVNSGSDDLAVIAGDSVAARIPVGSQPLKSCYNPVRDKVYVANFSNGLVSVIDGASNKVLANVRVGYRNWDICYASEVDKVYCPSWVEGCVSVIDCATDSVIARVPVDTLPYYVAYSPEQNAVYCANDDYHDYRVTVIDCAADTVRASIRLPGNPYGPCYNSVGDKLYWGAQGYDTKVISCSLDSIVGVIPGVQNHGAGGHFPTYNKAYLPSAGFYVVDGATDTVVAHIEPPLHGTSNDVCFNTRMDKVYLSFTPIIGGSPHVLVVDAATDSVLKDIRPDIPTELCYNAMNNKVYVCEPLDPDPARVSIIDCEVDEITGQIPVGRWPRYMTWNPVANRVYVSNWFSGSVSVIRDSMVPGVEENPPTREVTSRPGPTVIRAVLHMPETGMTNARYPMTLLDVAGRCVMELTPGVNDVRHLSPGVYFVRPAGTVPASGIPGDSPFRAKVILTR